LTVPWEPDSKGENALKITDLQTFLVHPGRAKNLCFVKIDTDTGIHGWGECYTQSDRDRQIVTHVEQLARYLIGRNPMHIKHFMQVAYDDFAGRRGAMDLYSALSGIEQALWDITGKQLGVPVYALLGGACRDKIRVYANGWSDGAKTPETLAEKAVQVIERGFTALKFDPVPGPWRTYISKDIERQTVRNVQAVREAVGPEVDILVEMHRRLAPMYAIRIARELEPYHPFWYEEPVLAENIDALATAKRAINIPVVTGEELYTKFEFREVFEKQAADIINPDVCNVGGILELKEIAAMAEPYFVVVSPHNYNSTTVGLAATLQVSTCIPNFLITEYFVNLESFGHTIARSPFEVVNGYITIPKTPGLGIDLDEEALAKHPYQPFPARSPRQYHEEGP
jgi:galactonate dehydratase